MKRLNFSDKTQQVTALEKQITPVSGQEVTAITPSKSTKDTKKTVSPSVGHLLLGLGVLLGAGAIASGIYTYRLWLYNQRFPQTDNAYVTADIHPVTSRISGMVTEVAVNDNQVVSPGIVLVKLDRQDQQASLNQAKASLELAKEQAQLARENISAIANIPEPRPANSANRNSQAQQIQNIIQQRQIKQQQYKTALANVAQKEAEVKKSELQLSYTNITPLVGGKVASKNVQVGQQVKPGQTLITVVQPNPWIIANFQENQLEKIQPRQKVGVKIAAFPSRTFQGRVDSMSATSASQFASASQENNTVNFTKNSDVQRIPVKIVFEPSSIRGYEYRITPGMSAAVTVETTDK